MRSAPTNRRTHEEWMQVALDLARKAESLGEVPVGAILVKGGRVIGEGFNQPITACDPTAHAEIIALRNAAIHEKNYRLPGTTLYVTIEPCAMCAGALIHARVEHLVYAAKEPRAGAIDSHIQLYKNEFFNHKISVLGGILEADSSLLMRSFFRKKR
ncbi:MAG: tRNA adenosine(34) deaminase TadA [Pseudomonadales bacterium]|nr:tRNA adenosine(34) deaminase TadA [Pseudomonadales bacterium]